jgi:hypothetical protein
MAYSRHGGEVRNSYIILVLNPEEKTPLAILRHKIGGYY